MGYFLHTALVVLVSPLLIAMQSFSPHSGLQPVSPLKDISPLESSSAPILCEHEKNELYKNECLAWVRIEWYGATRGRGDAFDPRVPLDKKFAESWKSRRFCLDLFLRTREKLPALLNNAIYFHGTSSAALLMYMEQFSDPADAGALLSLGYLESIHKVPFSGEIVFGRSEVNRKYVSLTNLDDINTAIMYAKAGAPVTLSSLQRILVKAQEELKHYPKNIMAKNAVEIQKQRIARFSFKKFFVRQKRFLARPPFPVLFGVVLDPKKEVITVRSGIKGERAVERVDANEIKVIFVPLKYISQVKNILAKYAPSLSANIHVESLQALKRFVVTPRSPPQKIAPQDFAGFSWSDNEFLRLRLDARYDARPAWDADNWNACLYPKP